MSHDPYWSMPLVNWQPTSSFNYPYPPPPDAPDAGELITLPCINRFWLQLLAGAAMQLRNPATWNTSGDEDALSAVLTQADQLLFMLGEGIACVNPLVDLTFASCTFTKHFADGSTGAIVDWADAFCSCALGCATPVPPPVGEMPGAQRACNIAGYLATAVIQGSMQAVHDALAADQNVVEYAQAASQAFAAILPLTYYAIQAFVDWYHTAAGELLSDVAAVAADESLWSTVTCAIFSAIDTVGYVDASNFSAVAANLGAISYPKAWVPGDLETFWTNMGLNNWQNAQDVGAVDDVDCTACTTGWCKHFDFTASTAGWELDPALPLGTYVPGLGWQSVSTMPDGDLEVIISIDTPFVANVTEMQIRYIKGVGDSTVAHAPVVEVQNPIGTETAGALLPGLSSYPGASWASATVAGTCLRAVIDLIGTAGDPSRVVITGAQLRGTGVCPFDLPNDCVVGP